MPVPMEGIDATRSLADQGAGREIITSSELALSVPDPEKTADEVTKIAGELDGRIEDRTVAAETEYSGASAQLLLRVPAPRLSEAIASVSELGTVTRQSTNKQDVTEIRVDLEARQESLAKSVSRLEELLREAKTTADLVEAESALAQRQAELAGITAQLDSLTEQIELSSLWVVLETPADAPRATPGTPLDWLQSGVASIGAFLLWLAGAIVFLVPWAVFLAALIALIVWLRRLARKRAERRSRETATAAQEVDAERDAKTTAGLPTEPGGPAPR